MGREQTLLERIARRHSDSRRRDEQSAVEDVEALMESVRANLVRLLNARHGMSEAQPDYGLPSFNDLTAGNQPNVIAVQDAIRSTIEKYEPRLRRVRVLVNVEASARQTLVFRVEAVLIARSGEQRIWYETALRSTGNFDVTG